MLGFIIFIVYILGFLGVLFVIGQLWARKEIHIHKFIEVAGIPIHYQVNGPENAKAIILVHGMFANNECWDVVRPLLQQNYRIYTIDLPGMGESSLENANVSPQFIISSIEDLLYGFGQALNLERPHVIGSSLGGVVASLNFNKYPNYFDKCVLVSAPMNPQIMLLPFFKLAPLSLFLNIFVNPILVGCTHYIASRPNHSLNQMLAILCKFRRVNHFKYSLLYTQLIYRTQQLAKTWASPKSTFYIWGTQDHMIRSENFKSFLALNKDIQFAKVDNGTHHPMESHPKEFYSFVHQFLSASEKP